MLAPLFPTFPQLGQTEVLSALMGHGKSTKEDADKFHTQGLCCSTRGKSRSNSAATKSRSNSNVDWMHKDGNRPENLENPQHGNRPENPQTALQHLREGNLRFVKGEILAPNRSIEALKRVEGGQKPFAAFLSCADSRVPVEIIFDQGFGDVFITRVAGNIVTTEVIASLEFGTAVLGCKVLYVLGHTKCGAVAATAAGNAVPGVISSLYYSIKPACEAAKNDVEEAIKHNVRFQAKALSVSPVIAGLVKENKLTIVGGVYDLATGKVTEVSLN
eukprot:g79711.t1